MKCAYFEKECTKGGAGISCINYMRSATCAMYARMLVGANGVIQVQAISDGAEFAADKWFPIHCTFMID